MMISGGMIIGIPSVLHAAMITQAPPLAYVGPGAGLGAIGALLAVLSAIVIGVAGLVLYPLQVLRNWLRGNRKTAGDSTDASTDASS
jgi:hypothetical protein